jgi:hypothetical protein
VAPICKSNFLFFKFPLKHLSVHTAQTPETDEVCSVDVLLTRKIYSVRMMLVSGNSYQDPLVWVSGDTILGIAADAGYVLVII